MPTRTPRSLNCPRFRADDGQQRFGRSNQAHAASLRRPREVHAGGCRRRLKAAREPRARHGPFLLLVMLAQAPRRRAERCRGEAPRARFFVGGGRERDGRPGAGVDPLGDGAEEDSCSAPVPLGAATTPSTTRFGAPSFPPARSPFDGLVKGPDVSPRASSRTRVAPIVMLGYSALMAGSLKGWAQDAVIVLRGGAGRAGGQPSPSSSRSAGSGPFVLRPDALAAVDDPRPLRQQPLVSSPGTPRGPRPSLVSRAASWPCSAATNTPGWRFSSEARSRSRRACCAWQQTSTTSPTSWWARSPARRSASAFPCCFNQGEARGERVAGRHRAARTVLISRRRTATGPPRGLPLQRALAQSRTPRASSVANRPAGHRSSRRTQSTRTACAALPPSPCAAASGPRAPGSASRPTSSRPLSGSPNTARGGRAPSGPPAARATTFLEPRGRASAAAAVCTPGMPEGELGYGFAFSSRVCGAVVGPEHVDEPALHNRVPQRRAVAPSRIGGFICANVPSVS